MLIVLSSAAPLYYADEARTSISILFPGNLRIGDNRAMELLVYSADWCRDCREAKRFLARHAIPYTEIDIEKTPGAAEQVIAQTGKRGIPQFVLDGKWIQPYKPSQGFLHDEMAELFGVAQP